MDLIGKVYIKLSKNTYFSYDLCLNYYYQYIIFTVSIGGTLGLFLGVSLLSIVEIIYYFVVWTRKRPRNISSITNKKQIHPVIRNVNKLPFLH